MQSPSRRSFIMALGAVALGAAKAQASSPPSLFFKRIRKPIGLQVYTLGPDAGRDIDATFAAIARIGYREIELPNLLGKQPAEVAAAAARAGIAIRSLHVPLVRGSTAAGVTFGSSAQQLADTLGALGARWAVAPIMLLPEGFRPGKGESSARRLPDPQLPPAPTCGRKARRSSIRRPMPCGLSAMALPITTTTSNLLP